MALLTKKKCLKWPPGQVRLSFIRRQTIPEPRCCCSKCYAAKRTSCVRPTTSVRVSAERNFWRRRWWRVGRRQPGCLGRAAALEASAVGKAPVRCGLYIVVCQWSAWPQRSAPTADVASTRQWCCIVQCVATVQATGNEGLDDRPGGIHGRASDGLSQLTQLIVVYGLRILHNIKFVLTNAVLSPNLFDQRIWVCAYSFYTWIMANLTPFDAHCCHMGSL